MQTRVHWQAVHAPGPSSSSRRVGAAGFHVRVLVFSLLLVVLHAANKRSKVAPHAAQHMPLPRRSIEQRRAVTK